MAYSNDENFLHTCWNLQQLAKIDLSKDHPDKLSIEAYF